MKRLWWTVLTVAVVSGYHPSTHKSLRGIYSWKSLEFEFPSKSAELAAIQSGDYIPGAPLPIDVDVYNEDKTKISPRRAGLVGVMDSRFLKRLSAASTCVRSRNRSPWTHTWDLRQSVG